jgi:hypothetical protein
LGHHSNRLNSTSSLGCQLLLPDTREVFIQSGKETQMTKNFTKIAADVIAVTGFASWKKLLIVASVVTIAVAGLPAAFNTPATAAPHGSARGGPDPDHDGDGARDRIGGRDIDHYGKVGGMSDRGERGGTTDQTTDDATSVGFKSGK